MPLIKVFSSAPSLSRGETTALLRRLSSELAVVLGKPEAYVMTCMMPRAEMTFAADSQPCAYAEVKSIGRMTPEITKKLSASVCSTLSEALHVPADRIYIEFQDAERHLWGFDGGTFA